MAYLHVHTSVHQTHGQISFAIVHQITFAIGNPAYICRRLSMRACMKQYSACPRAMLLVRGDGDRMGRGGG